jgi:DNA-binding response OmpR family regulator
MKILLLEDDATLSNEIKKYFNSRSIECDAVLDGISAEKYFKIGKYELAILDVNVPGLNGNEVCKRIRLIDDKLPILMLTAFGEIEDKLLAFSNGADDYLVKPFHFEELMARVNALVKRNEIHNTESDIIVGDLRISNYEKKVFWNHQEIELTPKEYNLLIILSNANGRIVSKQFISEKLWGDQMITNQNTIEVYINSLRKKIDKMTGIKLIHTKVGFGYFIKQKG